MPAPRPPPRPWQELFANGVANLLGAVSSGFPVSGSFSRSSLNYVSGARYGSLRISVPLSSFS